MKTQYFDQLKQGALAWNQWRADNPDLQIDLSRSKLTSMDLSGFDLSGCRLVAADFIDANLQNANLSGADCRRARFIAARLKGTKLDHAVLEGADFLTAVVANISMVGLDLRSINLTSFDLKHACLNGVNLQGVDLSGFNLLGSQLKNAQMANARLVGCNLSGTDFSGSDLSNAQFDKSNLKNAHLLKVTACSASFQSVNAENANFAEADLRLVNFTQAKLDNAILNDTLLSGIQTQRWSIKKIQCNSCSWDQKGKEFERFNKGNFERLYGDSLTLSISYPNCIQLAELATLPFLVEHLTASQWGCHIQLESILHLPGHSEVSLAITDTGDFEPSELLTALKQEIEQLHLAQLELRGDRKLNQDLKAALSNLKEQFWPRMLELAAEHQANQQRQLTVLFMDLKDFSKWSDVEMSSRLELFRGLLKPILTRWQAVYPNMEGDSLRAAFYNPSLAVQCGLMIQKVLTAAGFHLRVGMDMGPVQISHNDVTGIADLGGNALNFAARLETLAQPGEVLLTERVRHFSAALESTVQFVSRKVTLNKAVGELEAGTLINCYQAVV